MYPRFGKGLYVKSDNVLNELNYCLVSNGGSGSFDGNSTKVANIRVVAECKIEVDQQHELEAAEKMACW
jgi:hypothetical protein